MVVTMLAKKGFEIPNKSTLKQ